MHHSKKIISAKSHFFCFLMLCSVMFSCKETSDKQKEDKASHSLALMEVDRSFSGMSKEKGMKAAFIEYIDSNGVLLRPGQLPLTGGAAIDYLVLQNDSDYSLTWDPQHAVVCESGELGFTYGIYVIRPHAMDTAFFGTYTHIWNKQSDGKWKLVLNSVNEGINQTDENAQLH